jgi:hypothetical protein
MRIPLAAPLESRDGTLDQDAKVVNALVEVKGEKASIRKRPGLVDLGLIKAGVAQLLTYWDGRIIAVQDDYINRGGFQGYATLNSADKGADITLSGSDLVATIPTTSDDSVRATLSKSSGKWYWEVTATTLTTVNIAVGVANASLSMTANAIGSTSNGTAAIGSNDAISFNNSNINTSFDINQGNVIGLALDMDNRTLAFYLNGTLVDTAVSAELPAGALYPAVGGNGNSNQTVLTCNFGASDFAHTVPPGFNAGFYTEGDFVSASSTALTVGTADLMFSAQDNGRNAPKPYLMFKNAEKAWTLDTSGNVAAITDTDYPGTYSVTLTNLTQTGGTATATTAVDTNFQVGSSVTIAGATPTDYNGAKTILSVTPSVASSTEPVKITITRSSTTATAVSPEGPHGFTNGQSVTIEGAGQAEYNGAKTITWISATSFSFTVTVTGSEAATTATGSPSIATWNDNSASGYNNFTDNETVVVSTPSGNTLANSDTITVDAANGEAAGSRTVANRSASGFEFEVTGLATRIGGSKLLFTRTPPTLSSITRSGVNFTFTTSGAHKFNYGDTIKITGATEEVFNGTFSIGSVTSTTATGRYSDPARESLLAGASSPATPATGEITAQVNTATGASFTFAVSSGASSPATGTITATGGRNTVPGIVYIDGYFVVMDIYGVIYNSPEDDPATWNALEYLPALAEPGAGRAITKSLSYIVAFKEWSTEFFYNAGNPSESPFSPVPNLFLLVGCAAGWSVAEVAGRLLWIAQAKKQTGRMVYMMMGSESQKVSDEDVERVLNADDLAAVSAYGVTLDGHPCYVLTLGTTDVTLVFDLISKTWAQWTSLTVGSPVSVSSITRSGTTATVTFGSAHGLSDGDPVLIAGANQGDYNGIFQASRSSSTVITIEVANSPVTPATGTITGAPYTESAFKFTKYTAADGDDLVLHESDGHLYRFSSSLYQDDGVPVNVFARTKRLDAGDLGTTKMPVIRVIGDSVASTAMIRTSDDDSTTFSAYRRVTLSDAEPEIRRCGSFRRRTIEFRHVANTALRVSDLELEVGR